VRILVTGGAGFIGSHIVDALLDHGHEVVIFDLLSESTHPLGCDTAIQPGVDLVVGDVRDSDVVFSALAGVDVVCHQAAKVGLGIDIGDLPEYVSHNSLGTAVVLAAMAQRNVTRLVLASSMVIYGEGGYTCVDHGPMHAPPRRVADLDAGMFEPRCGSCFQPLFMQTVPESAPADPRNVYAATKLSQEHLAQSWVRETGGTATALRYHNVYGPRMPRDTPYAGVASIFRSSLELGEAPKVFEDGGQQRDFVHVTDVATANLRAIESDRTGFGAFNVASGEPHTIGELATALAMVRGGPAPIITRQYRLGDVRHIVADSAEIEACLGFRARVPWLSGVEDFAFAPLRDTRAERQRGKQPLKVPSGR
jgi:dTDP-L-rhamnose 4-epimerase